MLFVTATFAVFTCVAVLASHALASRPLAWKWVMLTGSWVFYGWYEPRVTVLLAAAGTMTWAVARPAVLARPPAAAAVVVALLAPLAVLKYGAFAADTVASLGGPERTWTPALLPLGISFFTFQAVSHVIDVRRGDAEARSWLDTNLFVAFFPQLVAGPIVRSSGFFGQLDEWPKRILSPSTALGLIAVGAAKKVIVADTLLAAVGPVHRNPGAYSSLDVAFSLYAGAARTFADVSAYADIAVGVGLLVGFRLPYNFAKPYAATSIADFWRRWHITLSHWMRDYVHRPLLAGSRHPARIALSAVVTMTASGLWHGAGWGFALWGALHGAVLAVEGVRRLRRIERRTRRREPSPLGRTVRRAATFHFVVLSGLLFAGMSLSQIAALGGALAGNWTIPSTVEPLAALCVVAVFASQFAPARLAERCAPRLDRLPLPVTAAAFALTLTVIAGLSPDGLAPFLYYRF